MEVLSDSVDSGQVLAEHGVVSLAMRRNFRDLLEVALDVGPCVLENLFALFGLQQLFEGVDGVKSLHDQAEVA